MRSLRAPRTTRTKEPTLTRQPAVAAAFSLVSLATACGGESLPCRSGAPACASADAGPAAPIHTRSAAFRGDGSEMPSFGGWGSDPLPAEAVAHAGFDWFETGYRGDAHANEVLANAGVRPFAYISLGELDGKLAGAAGYGGSFLR